VSIHRHIYPDPMEAATACANHIAGLLEEALRGEGEATLALSGGSTPKLMLPQLVEAKIAWDRVHIFQVDERAVPPTDSESNYKMLHEAFFVPAHVPTRNVHRIHAELRPDAAAQRYTDEIREYFQLLPGEIPHFDVMQRGMGPDAHTASLFPGEPLIEDREGIAAAVYVDKLSQWRITMLPAVLLAAHHTSMLVSGKDKADAVRDVLCDTYDPQKYPAQIVTHHGRRVVWFLDEAAAALMEA
jgi:6-phosphogluconolactonase